MRKTEAEQRAKQRYLRNVKILHGSVTQSILLREVARLEKLCEDASRMAYWAEEEANRLKERT